MDFPCVALKLMNVGKMEIGYKMMLQIINNVSVALLRLGLFKFMKNLCFCRPQKSGYLPNLSCEVST